MKALGLDIGSSSIKGAVLELDRNKLGATASRPFPALVPGLPQGWFEVSPPAVETEVRKVLEQLSYAAPDARSLFVSGQMGGLVLTDEVGSPLGNYYSWRDQRTLKPAPSGRTYWDELRRRWSGEMLDSLGNELQPGSLTALLYWLVSNERLPAGAVPVSIADYVIGRLCGMRPKMHVTQAIGILDLRTSHWHEAAIESLSANSLRWPELGQAIEPVGTCTIAGRSVTVFGAYGDQQCALRGAELRREELSINISTGSQVSQRVATMKPGRYQTRRYFDGDWLNTVTHLPAGRSLNVLVDLLCELANAEGVELKRPWETILERASSAVESDLQVDLSFFTGPLGTTGSISEITTENLTVGQLFHAAFRSMADNYAKCACWLDPDEGWQSVVLSGGLARSTPRVRDMIAARFPVPIRVAADEETLLGLLQLARTCSLV